MYGPLNGVRIALVALAVLAVITLAVLGETVGALALAAGVAFHAYGWVYLKRKAAETKSSAELGR
jgi:EamA domain-containing membrane protein RarD